MDGSKTHYAAGYAAITGQSEYFAKLSNLAFRYTAELIVILLVINNVLYQHSGYYFTILTHSKSALVSLQSFYQTNPIILDVLYFFSACF